MVFFILQPLLVKLIIRFERLAEYDLNPLNITNKSYMLRLSIVTILAFLVISLSGYSQRTTVERILQEDGLPCDLVKALAMDSSGFVWAVTDDGLAKIEGSNIVKADDPLQFFDMYKDILLSKNFGMVATADSGILALGQSYKGLQSGYLAQKSPIANLEHYKFPKTIYESNDSSLWIAFPEQIVRIKQKKSKEYRFPVKNHTYNFYRSYQFIEPGDEHFYMLSQKGYLHLYNEENDAFTEIPWNYAGTQIFYSLKITDQQYLIGCDEGLLQMNFENGEIRDVIDLGFDYPVSVITPKSANEFVIGTWKQGAYELRFENGKPVFEILQGSEEQIIMDILLDNQKQVWLATSSGIFIYRHMVFDLPFSELIGKNIRNVTPGLEGTILFSVDNLLYRIGSNNNLSMLLTVKEGEVTSIAVDKNRIFIGTSNGHIICRHTTGSNTHFDFSKQGEAIYSLAIDMNSDLWVLQSRSDAPTLLKMDKAGITLDLTPKINPEGDFNLNALKISPNGELFIAAGGINQYLYKYNYQTGVIENLSIPIKALGNELLWNFDLNFMDEQTLFLASHKGIYRYHDKTMEHLDLGFHTSKTIFAIISDKSERVWGNVHNGLLCYNNGITTLYNDADGLPNKMVNPGGLYVDNQNNLWVGTVSGWALSKLPTAMKTSSTPTITSIKKSGLIINGDEENRFLQNSLLHFTFASPDYPAKYTLYQYAMTEKSKPDNWIDIESKNEYLFFDYLKDGDYTLKIRAKTKGHYSWSEPVTYKFSVYKIWYTRPEIIISLNIFFLFLVYLYVRYRQVKSTKEKLKLEAIIADRTKDLKNQNEELVVAKEKVEEAIKTKDRFFSILGHDLSSPFNALIGYSKLLVQNPQMFDEEKKTQIYKDILKTSENTHKLLRNLLDWSLSQTGKLRISKELIDFNLFLAEILPTLEATAKQKRISILVEITDDITIFADKAMIATILRNLVSNAIKFSNPKSNISISARMDNSFGYISITDHGVGMSEENVKNLFAIDKNNSTLGTNNEKGTGLGLVLCKEFATLNKGDIFVVSEPNKGSTFTLKLPSKAIVST